MGDTGGREHALARLAEAEALSRDMTRRARGSHGGPVSCVLVGLLLGAATFTSGYVGAWPALVLPTSAVMFGAGIVLALAIGRYAARRPVQVALRAEQVWLPLTGAVLMMVVFVAGAALVHASTGLWAVLSIPPVLPLLVLAWREARR